MKKVTILVGLAMLCGGIQWWRTPRIDDPESHQVQIVSRPAGATVAQVKADLGALQLGKTLSGQTKLVPLGETPLNLEIDGPAGFQLLAPGYYVELLEVSPAQRGRVVSARLRPRWPDFVWGAPLHWARHFPGLALGLLLLALGLAQGLVLIGARRRFWREERQRRNAELGPGVMVGNYKLERLLGQGGMGRVFQARHQDHGEAVAVKLLFEGMALDPDSKRRFLNEARALHQLHRGWRGHENIVKLLDWGEHYDQPYLILELVEGVPLDRVWSTRQSWSSVRPVACQILSALIHIHEAGWVHRDLKPSNLMLLPGGRVKLLDFGISFQDGQQSSAIRGTPGFMAPEGIAGESLDWRSDFYSLGVMLWEALAGESLWGDEDNVVVRFARQLEEVARPLAAEAAPERVRQQLAQLLERNPDDRLRSLDEARQLLAEWQAG